MAVTKSSTLTLRMDPCLKEALRLAATQEHRSITNMVEVMIREYCYRAGITVPKQQALFSDGTVTSSDTTD